MKAAQRFAYGGPEVIQINDIPIPEPRSNEVRIKVMSTTVNRTDCALLTAKPIIMQAITGIMAPRSPAIGTDFAGVIDAIGSKASHFKLGDRVWGFYDNGLGSHAEYFCMDKKKPMAILSDNISFTDAAASIEGAHYALNFLRFLKLKKGAKVMVNGGTGAIGSALIQLLAVEGCEITATCRSAHFNQVKKLGAHNLINYETEDFTKTDDQFEYVLDAVGKSTFAQCKKILSPTGTYISSELGPWAQNPLLSLTTALGKSRKVKFPIPLDIPNSLSKIGALLSANRYAPLVEKTFPLDDIQSAYAHAISGKKVGSLLIKIT